MEETVWIDKEKLHEYRSLVRSLAGSPFTPGYGERLAKSVQEVFEDSPYTENMTLEEFHRQIFHSKHDYKPKPKNPVKQKVTEQKPDKKKHPSHHLGNGSFPISYSDLVRKIADQLGKLPSDDFMDALGNVLGYSGAIWRATKKNLTDRHGYRFEPSAKNGYIVYQPDPVRKRMAEIDEQIRSLQAEKKVLQIGKIEITE